MSRWSWFSSWLDGVARVVLISAALSSIVSCGDDFDPPSRVNKLRVLAVGTQEPFASPGEEVSLSALVFDPSGRRLSWTWATCTDPSSTSVLGCFSELDPATVTTSTGGEGATFTMRIPADALSRLPEASRASAMVGAVFVACPGTISKGGEGGVPFSCTDDAGRVLPLDAFEIGAKRIFVRARDKNPVPTFTSLSWDGAPWAEDDVKEVDACDTSGNEIDDCASVAHRITASSTPPDTGVDELGTPFTEAQVVQFYATEGIFEDAVRRWDDATTRWAARTSSKGTEIRFWFVVRDDRGGVSWTQRTVRVR